MRPLKFIAVTAKAPAVVTVALALPRLSVPPVAVLESTVLPLVAVNL